MKFTGERFIPDMLDNHELEVEHMQRYMSVLPVIKDKVVLDAACGEGYGSSMMAEYADRVYGIDSSEEVIEHATSKYSRGNLFFQTASIEAIPLADNSVDVVVSFETIEHVKQDIQHTFLTEVKRVLKEDGVFIISTPDKRVYSDIPGYKNEFHVREFYQDEFESFLKRYFPVVDLYYQGFQVHPVITAPNTAELTVLQTQEKQIKEAKYMIAVCSHDTHLNRSVNLGTAILDPEQNYEKLTSRIVSLQDEVEERNHHLHYLDNEIAIRDQQIASLVEKAEHDRLTSQALLKSYEEQIEKYKDGKIQLETELHNKRGHIELLLEQERILHNITGSWEWRLVKKFHKIRDRFFPRGTKRRLFTKLALKTIKNPRLMIGRINSHNLKVFLRHLKTNEITMLENKVQNQITMYSPSERPEVKLIEPVDVQEKIILPKLDHPLVSIVIPVYNKWEYTYSCLRSILEHTQNVAYEVILADDMSSDETVNAASIVENMKIVRDGVNRGFLLNCNNAAKYASGTYLLFLNNDTNVQPDWLKYLVDLIERDETIGMVGSKLIYGDGRLQEAGGIIWNDASGWNYGRLDDPEKPEYNYVKEVDYISGASIMIRTSLWSEIGGFDERYVPAYYEDSDLAFEVRKRGYKVVYQPKSVVVHFEGVSHGTDTNSGIKSYQVRNKEEFVEKWKEVLENRHFPNAEHVFWARDRSRDKKTIVVIDHYVPQYDKDAGSRTTYQYLKLFVEMGLNVKFIGDNFYKDERYCSKLEQLGIEVLYGDWYLRQYKEWIKTHGQKIDYVYLNRPHISIKYIDFIKKHTNARILYYGHDLHYLRESREYELTKNPALLASSHEWKKIEHELIEKADVIYYPSYVEINEVKKYFPHSHAKAIPAYIFDQKKVEATGFEQRKHLLFVGGFGHKPNIDAVLWFVKEIFPLIVAKIPDIIFYVVGSNPPPEIQGLQSSNIKVTGFVTDEELEHYYHKCRVVVVPLRYGAGVKGKVVEAIYYQIPIVTTSIGAEGLPDAEQVLTIEDDVAKFAEAVVRIYDDALWYQEMLKRTKSYIQENFSSETVIGVISDDIKP
ncbi:GT2 family glycosyltransferase [Aneurinibacillus soli]|uniref:Putative S-adenosylmethionine-dependent methyltransferase/MSMEI_2290 n=1 Tax=Aneurinibacillus soli TaxID=1500254 RepID=A0A0U5B8I1_9BACL|nr:glycosyltransferase [Aneurinibacillus soli]PYE61542.1 GT2 family glycosyltransferase [Aneurinibacillus soli]BAU26503.1 putative S-adenosylmethionine-dependent methyltransferase/MSMEI_2290 [Aneurinibacillus soli]